MKENQEGYWDLRDLYEGIDSHAFISDKEHITNRVRKLCQTYEGNVCQLQPEEFAVAFEQYQSLYEDIYKLYLYVYLLWCGETSRSDYSIQLQEIQEKVNTWQKALLFFELEWQQMDESHYKKILSSNSLRKGKHYLLESYSKRVHRLNKECEKIMTQQSLTAQSAWVKLYDETLYSLSYRVGGKTYTQSELLSWLYKPKREQRKQAHKSLTTTFKKSAKLIAYIFNTLLLSKKQEDELRGYESWDTSRHQDNQISNKVVQSLVNVVRNAYPMVQHFYKLKKSLLGISRFYDYDRYSSYDFGTKDLLFLGLMLLRL